MNRPEPELETYALHCMEIWGGNRALRQAIGTPGLDLWIFGEPFHGEARGGDVHYVSLCGGGLITRLIIADVSGHGVEVAGFSKALRDLMRRHINSKSQERLVKALNREFAELAQLERFATAIVATYLASDDRLTVCNAAHPRPIYYRATTRTWSILSNQAIGSAMNLPLGIDEESTYDQFSIQLEPGDFVIFYTDALTEAMRPSGELLGEPGLLEILNSLSMSEPNDLAPGLLDAVRAFRGGLVAEDDVTLLVLHHNAGPARPPSIGEKLEVYAKVFGLKPI